MASHQHRTGHRPYRRTWTWIALAVLLVIATVFLGSCGGGDDEQATATPSASPTASATPTITPTATATATATTTPTPTTTPSATFTPTATPSPTPTVTPSPSPTPCVGRTDWDVYPVQDGDTLASIARRVGITRDELAAANCLQATSLLFAGQELRVPRPPTDADTAALQRADEPLIMLINGDLWAWSAANPALAQITRSGTNGPPAISPDGTRVAFTAWSDITQDAVQRGETLAGTTPNDIMLWNLADGTLTPLAEQPAGAAFLQPDVDDLALMRGQPCWSPDGTALAWTELVLPAYTRQLVIADLATGATTVLVENLPTPTVDAGDIALAEVAWGANGLVLLNTVRNRATGDAVQTVYLYASDGTPRQVVEIAATARGEALVVYHTWITHDDEPTLLGLLDAAGTWRSLDPTTGTLRELQPGPELVAAGAATSLSARATETAGTGLRWALIDAARTAQTPLAFSGLPARVAIAPDGSAAATMSDAVYIHQPGKPVQRVPNTDNLGGTGRAGLTWGPPQWMLPDAVPDLAGPDDATTADCPLAPALSVGDAARAVPGAALALRQAPSGRPDPAADPVRGGDIVTVIGGPACKNGAIWWQVSSVRGFGWVPETVAGVPQFAPQDAAAEACMLPTRLKIDYAGMVVPGQPGDLRAEPRADSAVLVQVPSGGTVLVMDGPVCADGFNWWYVNSGGIPGWAAEGANNDYWLTPLGCPNSPPSRLTLGMVARTLPETPGIFRSQPRTGEGSEVLDIIPYNEVVIVSGGPQCGPNGRLWWEVEWNGQFGWTVEGEDAAYWMEPFTG